MVILVKVLSFLAFNICLTNCVQKRNILFNEFKDKSKCLKDITVWKTKLKNDFISNLHKMPENIKNDVIKRGDQQLTQDWGPLLAMDFLIYKKEGNRNIYQNKLMHRRTKLMRLVLAELLTGKDKYIKDIANGLWLILEESTWAYPAHLSAQRAGVGLPDPNQNIIDLGVGETAAYVSWVKFLLGDKLEKIDKIFNQRIDYEIDRRVVQPFLKSDFWWTGFSGKKTNNWNVWINSNILITSLLVLNEPQRTEVIKRSVQSVDIWINGYGNDGGCDEGPAYWGEAGGRFIEFLYYLTSVSDRQMDWSSNELFKNIGSYIYRMHIDGNYFVNFADSKATLSPDPNVILNYGQSLNDDSMRNFAAYFYVLGGKDWRLGDYSQKGHLNQFYLQMIAFNQLRDKTPKAPQPLESWFPDIQVLTLRSTEGSAKGLFLGAKAGSNYENHNHNDVGNFVIYVNGMPALIDVGVGTYTAKTFSKDRYTIWTMQSQWHSTPTINDVHQKDGNEFKATHVHYKHTANGGVFEADIAGAYPKEALVKSWIRTFTFDRTLNTIEMSEVYALTKVLKPFKLHFMTCLTPTPNPNNNQIVLKSVNTTLVMDFNSKEFDVVVDSHKTEDPNISGVWGESVNRVTLVSKKKDLKGGHKISFHL